MLFLSEKYSQQVLELLNDLLSRSESDAAYVCDHGGNIIASKVASAYDNEENIAALAAGSFSATNALANMIGEEGFDCIFHQSANMSIFMKSLTGDLILLVLFSARSNPGLVKLHSSHFSHVISPMIEAMTSTDEYTHNLEELIVEFDEQNQPFNRKSG